MTRNGICAVVAIGMGALFLVNAFAFSFKVTHGSDYLAVLGTAVNLFGGILSLVVASWFVNDQDELL